MTIFYKFSLKDRVAVVTGGGGQLGGEFCLTLAEAGAAVTIVDLNSEAIDKTVERLVNSGYKAKGVVTDITKPDSVDALIDSVLSTFGHLDILVKIGRAHV